MDRFTKSSDSLMTFGYDSTVSFAITALGLAKYVASDSTITYIESRSPPKGLSSSLSGRIFANVYAQMACCEPDSIRHSGDF
jgi:hypothetical protein